MKILDIFLERPRVLFLTLSFILLAGVSSALSLPVQENPELAQRWVFFLRCLRLEEAKEIKY